MDYGLMRIWDLAQVASKFSSHKAVKKTVSILSASTAIPGVFPPVVIDNLLYVDGGATMQVVGEMSNRAWAYTNDENQFDFVKKDSPIKIRVWIIVNQKLLSDTAVVPLQWPSIATRSLSTIIRTSMLQCILDAETFVGLINSRQEFDAQMNYVAIPQEFPIADSDNMFDSATKRELVKLGREMGRNHNSWKTKALRPSAPFD